MPREGLTQVAVRGDPPPHSTLISYLPALGVEILLRVKMTLPLPASMWVKLVAMVRLELSYIAKTGCFFRSLARQPGPNSAIFLRW